MKDPKWLNIPLGPARPNTFLFCITVLLALLLGIRIGRPATPEAWMYLLLIGLPLTWAVFTRLHWLDDWSRRCRYGFAPLLVLLARAALIVAIFKIERLSRPVTSWLWQQVGIWFPDIH